MEVEQDDVTLGAPVVVIVLHVLAGALVAHDVVTATPPPTANVAQLEAEVQVVV